MLSIVLLHININGYWLTVSIIGFYIIDSCFWITIQRFKYYQLPDLNLHNISDYQLSIKIGIGPPLLALLMK